MNDGIDAPGVPGVPGTLGAVGSDSTADAPGPDTADPEQEGLHVWAREHGITVNDRGRIPSRIRDAYEQAQATDGPAPRNA
ncbi:histone-like nucleoid-structuring protein Lsr2 [Kitasatospora sp. NPDC056181]|uniref:Lsr2 family DNA-binding protein n=1 Tax=Kitasatospora sp. NPDC056181 TaxID=3345737 RepID=UPI0035D552D7